MAQQTDKSDQKYRSLRNEFDNLQLEEKAVFLIESGLSLFIHGIESLTHFVRDEVNKMTEEKQDAESEQKEEKKEAPKKKTRSTASKRKTTRSSTSRRKTPPKDDAVSKEGSEDTE